MGSSTLSATRWRSASPAAKSTTSPRPRPSRPKCSPKPSSATKATTPTALFRTSKSAPSSRHPAKIESQGHARLRLRPLRRTQPHRAFLSIHQTVPRHRDPLRKNRAQFPRRPAFGLRLGLPQMRTRPSSARGRFWKISGGWDDRARRPDRATPTVNRERIPESVLF